MTGLVGSARLWYVVLDLPEPVAAAVQEVRRKFSPMRAEYPAEITVAGSGGVGPIAGEESPDTVFGVLDEIAATTAPIAAQFSEVRSFDGTSLFYFSIDDPAPLVALHKRVTSSGITFAHSQFPFTPHCTISGVALSEEQEVQIRDLSMEEAFVLQSLSVYSEPLPVERHYQARLSGAADLPTPMGS